MSRAVRTARRAGFARKRAHLASGVSSEAIASLDALLAQLPPAAAHIVTPPEDPPLNGQGQSAHFRRYLTLKTL